MSAHRIAWRRGRLGSARTRIACSVASGAMRRCNAAACGRASGCLADSASGTSSEHAVTAKRWGPGWELDIDGIGATQSKTLATAEQMIRDYIETLTDQDVSGADLAITPELGALEKKVKTVRAQVDAAERTQRDAAHAKRQLADDLRSAGLSVSDTAALLGVSRGRVSQLSNAS
jgi:hypothetical protein